MALMAVATVVSIIIELTNGNKTFGEATYISAFVFGQLCLVYLCITFIKIKKISDQQEMLQQRTQMIVIYLLAFVFEQLTILAIIFMQPF